MGDNLKQHNPNSIVLQSGIGVWLRVIWSNLCTLAQSLIPSRRLNKKKGSWLEFPSFTWEFKTTDWDGSNFPIGPLQALLAPSGIWAASWWGNAVTVTSSLNIRLLAGSPLKLCCLIGSSSSHSHEPSPTIKKFFLAPRSFADRI